MSAASSEGTRAWVGVVCQDHVARGVAGGFAQLCHGKQSPLMRMQTGDWLVYYSLSTEFRTGEPLRAFTALGRVVGADAYRFDMGGGFVPFRRDIAYCSVHPVLMTELAHRLHFTAKGSNWGFLARRGHFEIVLHDLALIAEAMRCPLPRAAQRPSLALQNARKQQGAAHRGDAHARIGGDFLRAGSTTEREPQAARRAQGRC